MARERTREREKERKKGDEISKILQKVGEINFKQNYSDNDADTMLWFNGLGQVIVYQGMI